MTQTQIYNSLKKDLSYENYKKVINLFGKSDVDFMIEFTDLKELEKFELKQKRKDKTFREKVLQLFQRKCVITGNIVRYKLDENIIDNTIFYIVINFILY